ncbi:MAG: His-Xaa-Ser system protein HxsD [Bacteroides sp.]|nr:His-Xaa-Ser system protein HxsD [Bacteroides sp.]
MTDFRRVGDNTFNFVVDTLIYNDTVISKVLYRLSENYWIERKSINEKIQSVLLENKSLQVITEEEEASLLKKQISQDFIDYKARNIIQQETQHIRDILYIKSFSNNDDFEDFNLIGN